MNQEEKKIDVYLMCEENKDYLVFDFEEPLKVNFNEESNQNELKEVFVRIILFQSKFFISNKIKTPNSSTMN